MLAINYENIALEESVELWNDCFSDYPTPMFMTGDSLTSRITKFGLSERLSFIMKEGDRFLGLILVGLHEFEGVRTAWVGGMGVRPLERHLGVAKAMLDEMELRVKKHGADVIKFEVLSENLKAKQLYLNKGYSVMTDLGIYQGYISADVKSDIFIKESKDKSEPKETPWQNRKFFNTSFDMILRGKKIGGVVLDEGVDNEGHKLLIIRQLNIPDIYIEQGLASLNQQYGNVSMIWSNFDEKNRVTQRLGNYGFRKINSQLQLKKELDS